MQKIGCILSAKIFGISSLVFLGMLFVRLAALDDTERLCTTLEKTAQTNQEYRNNSELFIVISGMRVPNTMVQRVVTMLNTIKNSNYALFEEIVLKVRANKPLADQSLEVVKRQNIAVNAKGRVGDCARAIIMAVVDENPETLCLNVHDITQRQQ